MTFFNVKGSVITGARGTSRELNALITLELDKLVIQERIKRTLRILDSRERDNSEVCDMKKNGQCRSETYIHLLFISGILTCKAAMGDQA